MGSSPLMRETRERNGGPPRAGRRGSLRTLETRDYGREAWALFIGLFQAEKSRLFASWSDLRMSPAQAQLLVRLQPDHSVPMNEIANSLMCDPSNVTNLVDRLEAQKLIERRADPKDRRVKMIAITKGGTKIREALFDRMSQPPSCIAGLSAREKKTLRDILRKATKAE